MSTIRLSKRKTSSRFSLKKILVGGGILVGTVLMAKVIYPYLSGKLDVDFLATKQHLVHLLHYRIAFYTHIFSSLPVLLSGVFLFSKTIQRQLPGLHRNIGKGYVGLVLLFAAPSGMVMAYYANGGVGAQFSFLLATPLWWWFTWQGLQTARQRNFVAHRAWMMRSYAMSFSAITLRASQLFLNEVDWVDPAYHYVVVAWESWLLNLGIVEIYLKMKIEADLN